jgi:hypothetical protein
VGQFVGKEFLPGCCFWCILSYPKDDILPHGESPRLQGLRHLSELAIGVDAHLAEVVAKARLKEGALGLGQRLPPAFEGVDAVFQVRCDLGGPVGLPFGLDRLLFFLWLPL